MKSSLYHLQINVSNFKSLDFYKNLFGYLEYKIIDESKEHIGASNGTADFWIIKTEGKYNKSYHRKATGLNHLAFKVKSRNDVDTFIKEFLKPLKIPILYNGPKEYPEYKKGYYAVYFEDPDRIKLEVAHVPN